MNITVLGIGLMGSAIANRLVSCGHQVTAWNRTPETALATLASDVKFEPDSPVAISEAEVVLLFLSEAAVINQVLQASPTSVLENKLIIQMGTIAPEESRELSAWLSSRNAGYLECPVLGSIPEARQGSLLLMAGGTEALFKKAHPVLKELGSSPQLIGPVGQAAALKLGLNQLIAGLTATFSLSLGFLEKEQVDLDKFMSILRDSAVYAPTFDKKLGKMLSGDYENPNFPLKHLDKDVGLFLSAAEPHGLHTETLQAIRSIITRGLEAGHADLDYSSLRESV